MVLLGFAWFCSVFRGFGRFGRREGFWEVFGTAFGRFLGFKIDKKCRCEKFKNSSSGMERQSEKSKYLKSPEIEKETIKCGIKWFDNDDLKDQWFADCKLKYNCSSAERSVNIKHLNCKVILALKKSKLRIGLHKILQYNHEDIA